MRMWMVDPKLMCNQHLLGEHVEIHMLAGMLAKGIRIHGYLERGLLAPQAANRRHDALVREMRMRRMNHKSPLATVLVTPSQHGRVDVLKSESVLAERCPECAFRLGRIKEREG